MKSSRSLFQLAVSMPSTEETEYGLLLGGGGDLADSKNTKRRARQLGETLASKNSGTPRNNKSAWVLVLADNYKVSTKFIQMIPRQ
jgi:hypothetical protein